MQKKARMGKIEEYEAGLQLEFLTTVSADRLSLLFLIVLYNA